MYGNTPNGGLPGTAPATGRPQGIDPTELNADDRESLREFATDIATATESYLPLGYWVDTMYQTSHGGLSLGITVGCPNGSMVQCEIQPEPTESDEMDAEEKEAQNAENVAQISQQLAATAAYQSMQVAEYHDDSTPPAA